MNPSFEQLKAMIILAKVVEHGSFSGAAKHLGLSRAVVSYHIKRLEEHLEVQLLHRSTRSVTLTDAGKQFYTHCQLIADETESAKLRMKQWKNAPRGKISITCPANMGLYAIVPALNVFKEVYPTVSLNIQLTDEVIDIQKEDIDLAIRSNGNGEGLKATQLTTLTTCLCGSPDYFNRKGRPVCIDDLTNHEWVLYSPGPATLRFSRGQRQHEVTPKGSITTNNAAARTMFIEGGQGIGRIPLYDARPKIQAGTLEAVMQDYDLPSIEVYGVYTQAKANNETLLLLVDYLTDYFARQALEHRII